MRIGIIGRRPVLCLLLCFLFIVGYCNYSISTIDFYSSGLNAVEMSLLDVAHKHSSMSGGMRDSLDYMENINVSSEFNFFQIKQSRWTSLNAGSSFSTAIIAALMAWLVYYSKLSDEIYTHSNSSKITSFLHKKDGMK